jgi:hypothetical protein
MKTQLNTKAKKLSTRFDHELRDLLLNDLMRFAFKKPSLTSNTKVNSPRELSMA